MKAILIIALFGVTCALPDGDLRRVVDYQGPSSTVSILRGADLDRGNSGEVRLLPARPRRVEYATRPAVQQRILYRQQQQPRPAATYVIRPRPTEQYRQPQRILYAAPQLQQQRTLYRPAPPRAAVVYQPQPTIRYVQQYRQPATAAAAPIYRPAPRDDSRERLAAYGSEGYDDAKYRFAYEVTDEYTGNYQAREESRDGKSLSGVYSVLDPDGLLRTVRYADDGWGLVAQVTREPSNLFGGGGGGGRSYASGPGILGGDSREK